MGREAFEVDEEENRVIEEQQEQGSFCLSSPFQASRLWHATPLAGAKLRYQNQIWDLLCTDSSRLQRVNKSLLCTTALLYNLTLGKEWQEGPWTERLAAPYRSKSTQGDQIRCAQQSD